MRPPTIRKVFTASDGSAITIRTLLPEDRELERAFILGLSPESKYSRFFSAIKDVSARMLDRFTRTDYPSELALVATIKRDNDEQQIGVARYAPGASSDSAEFAVVVADEWHGRGVGRSLLSCLFAEAETAGVKQIEGVVFRTNSEMLRLAKELGFDVGSYPGDVNLVRLRKSL